VRDLGSYYILEHSTEIQSCPPRLLLGLRQIQHRISSEDQAGRLPKIITHTLPPSQARFLGGFWAIWSSVGCAPLWPWPVFRKCTRKLQLKRRHGTAIKMIKRTVIKMVKVLPYIPSSKSTDSSNLKSKNSHDGYQLEASGSRQTACDLKMIYFVSIHGSLQ